jgi:alpha-glucosidase
MTTTALNKRDFELLVPLGEDGTSRGKLYIDDVESIAPKAVTRVEFSYARGRVQGKAAV